MTARTSRDRIFGLDVVRCVAIILVMISHTVLIVAPESEHMVAKVLRLGGVLGVDIFFVLSGFLIGGILLRYIETNRTSSRHLIYFWIRRWFRTLPNYYLILLINIGLGYWVFQNLPNDVWKYFFFFQNAIGPQPDFFLESWSLSIEEFSYIIGPLLLFLLFSFQMKKERSFLIATLAIILLGWATRGYYHLHTETIDYHFWTTNVRKVVLYRIDCIFYGFLAVYLFKKYATHIKNYRWVYFSAGSLLLAVVHGYLFFAGADVASEALFFNMAYLPLTGIAFALMIWHMSLIDRSQWSIARPILFISILSYALYLVNYSIVFLLLKKFIWGDTLLDQGILVILFWSLSLILAYLLYRFFEKPVMDLRDGKIAKRFLRN